MVATRNHPKDFGPPAIESPTKRSTRSSTATPPSPTVSTNATLSKSTSSSTTTRTSPPTKTTSGASRPTSPTEPAQSPTRLWSPSSYTSSRASRNAWSHTPSNLTLIWLAISLPLVVWDTGYVLLRPYSMPGGALHGPWKPYALYGTIDYVYGFKAWDAREGWTAAQGWFNAVETIAYFGYLYLVYTHGRPEKRQGRGAPDKSALGRLRALGESRTIYGKTATWAVLLGYSTALLTFSKTVLYWLREALSGRSILFHRDRAADVASDFSGIGHNDAVTLFFLWVIPNGLWLIFPVYMMYVFGMEILEGLGAAAGGARKNS